MASTIKVNNIQNQCGANIANKCGTTITLGASGDTITLACGASQTGFGRTGTVDWDTTAKTASFTAVSGNGYFVNTTSSAVTVTLPAGSAGSIVSLKDYANTWNTNSVTVTPNGTDKINGTNANATLNTQDQSVTLVYVDSTKGWRAVQDSTSDVTGNAFMVATGGTITTCGNCKIHTFTSPGTFTVCQIASLAPNNQVSYMVVAGGGGTAGDSWMGGGGAGGFREDKSPVTPYTASPLDGAGPITVTATSFPITVGAGGAGQPYLAGDGTPGANSVFSTITSTGGGGSEKYNSSTAGPSGGSGAGGTANTGTGGSGNTPPVSPPQGNPGGNATGNGGGGGGGAGGAGTNKTTPCTSAEPGGPGVTTNISASPVVYAAGGKGIGQSGSGVTPPCGAANTGNGGNGPVSNPSPGGTGGSGGSGIVIIRYKYQ